ncbi:bifunctional 4-hydroxy-2-oxoglutarate aldolase/2-dehydro-3-deoxy-phosphogluconate aldolase [Cellulomonas pakistanensis]|uniref:2-dehydro-3-deoxy-phosphogluconate aldolase n=1 Tax=Cellulomonas pakistanensis TaxID=992287 RepID=A0A919P7J8_9CELL|nr:bifunctional 4-hydroxy-2-oxoglutarate aldolase/2-dehydro-3-deoxy-phosphogluconate aldolase [Cellulomonas pakistanensis]GIG35541.1 2-dehydro-3-deoxy-phosphogluconate aldolase [Cellulomonas pakistanensis]
MTAGGAEAGSGARAGGGAGAAAFDRLAARPVVAILRAPDADRFLAASEVLWEAGFRCLEFTLTTRGALEAARRARAELPAELLLAVGTVRTERHVREAVDAGADLLVSQVLRAPLVELARSSGVPFVPGALTPTEVVAAWETGVPAVKVSPIGPVGGLEYLDQLRAPLPDIPLMPTGGVAVDEVGAYLARGAAAVGLSGPLLGDALLPGGDLGALRDRARRAVAGAAEAAAPTAARP